MPNITYPYTFSPNTLIQSAQVNANFTAITSVVNGALANNNIAAGAAIALSKLGLNPGGTAFNQSTSGQITWASGLTTDTQAQVQMTTSAGLQFGPGGSTVPDVGLIRSAANTLQVRQPSGAAAIFDGDAGTLQNFATITLSAGGTLNLNGGTLSGFAAAMVNCGRIYLASGAPYTDNAASSTLYYGPATGNQITLYNGVSEVTQTFSQVSLNLASLTASTCYDLYVVSSGASSVTLSTVAWSNTTTPPTRGTQDGRLTKNGSPTNLLVGSFYLNGATQAQDNIALRSISNLYNYINKPGYITDTTASWVTAANTTWATANSNTTAGVGQFQWMQTIPGWGFSSDTYGATGTTNPPGAVGIGYNSTSAVVAYANPYSTTVGTLACSYNGISIAGFNYLQRMQAGNPSGAATFLGSSVNWAGNTNALNAMVLT